MKAAHAIILFDGVCNLCNASVNFIIDHDPDGYFQFAAQQSAAGKALLEKFGMPPGELRTVLLIEQNHCRQKSNAALRIASRLRGPARLLSLGIVIPPFLRDAIYEWIAKHRYRWFGRTDACRIANAEKADRFLA
ncbi:MAG TPA: thiol-disulfide oxidoreductase DCC family protein [Tepidisphaeraceae bacterium]|nr:thiol-disulfide oxidoreductase DCC family protein [Tepidisphaeraceae bacterium]